MLRVYLLVFGIFITTFAFSQHKIGITTSIFDRSYSGYGVIDNWQAEARTYASPGFEVGLFYQYDITNWLYVKPEMRFLFDDGISINLLNLNHVVGDDDDTPLIHHAGGTYTRIDMPVHIGCYKKFNKVTIRAFAYLAPSMFFHTYSPDEYKSPWEDINIAYYDSFERFTLNSGYGFGIDFWRLSMDIYREDALTPLIRTVNYHGENYSFNLDASRLFLSIGFKIIND